MIIESIPTLAEKTIASITTHLSNLSSPASQVQIENAFTAPIQEAFKLIKSQEKGIEERIADRKQLYRKLSIKFHPDKIASGGELLAVHMRELCLNNDTLNNLPQQILEKHKDGLEDVIHDIKNASPNKIGEILTKLWRLIEESYNQYKRYYQPFRGPVYILRLILLGPIGFLGGLGVGVFMALSMITIYAEKKLLNFITHNQYQTELRNSVTMEMITKHVRNKLIDEFRIDTELDTDETAINVYLNMTNSDVSYEQGIVKLKDELGARIKGFAHLKLVFNSFRTVIPKPFQGAWKNAAMRVALSLLMITILLIDALSQLAHQLLAYLSISTMFATTACFLAIIFLSNIPLSIYDGLSTVANWIGNAFNHKATASKAPKNQEVPASYEPASSPTNFTEPVDITLKVLNRSSNQRTMNELPVSELSIFKPATDDKKVCHHDLAEIPLTNEFTSSGPL